MNPDLNGIADCHRLILNESGSFQLTVLPLIQLDLSVIDAVSIL